MREWYEITRDVLERRDKKIAQDKARAKVIKKTALSACCLCLAVVSSIGAWKLSRNTKELISAPDKANISIVETTDNGSVPEVSTVPENNVITTTSIASDPLETVTETETAGNKSGVPTATTQIADQSAGNSVVTSSVICRTNVPSAVVTAPAHSSSRTISTTAAVQVTPGAIVTTLVKSGDTTAPTQPSKITSPAESGETKLSDNERSIIMKKLSLFLAGVMATSTINLQDVNAVDNYDPSITEFMQQYTLCSCEDVFEKKVDNGEIDIDVNSDGKIDIDDCRLIYWYLNFKDKCDIDLEVTPEILDKIEIEMTEKIDYLWYGEHHYYYESYLPMYYFASHGGDSLDYCFPTYYDPEYKAPEEFSLERVENHLNYDLIENDLNYSFAYTYLHYMQYAGNNLASYKALEDFVENGKINLDINGNGKLDVYDYAAFRVFGEKSYAYTTDWKYLSFNYADGVNDFPIGCHVMSDNYRRAKEILPEDVWERVAAEYRKLPFYDFYDILDYMDKYIPAYFAMHMDLSPEYFDNEYFETLISGSSAWFLGDNLKTLAEYMDVLLNKRYLFSFDNDNFEKDLCNYYISVKEGIRPEPDINMDGIVDSNDLNDMDKYFNYVLVKDDPSKANLSEEVRNNISKNYDFNNNGIGGDNYDGSIVAFYFYYEEYLKKEEMKKNNTHPPVACERLESSSSEYLERSTNHCIPDDYSDIRSGDASGDGRLMMNDAVLILQSISNPDTFELDEQQSYEADIYNTGDGVTPMDALKVQKILIGVE